MTTVQTQVSRIAARPFCASQIPSDDPLVTSVPNGVAHYSLLFLLVTAGAIRLRVHCNPGGAMLYPCQLRHAPLSARLSDDVYETCINGYLDRQGWVMVAIRS